VAGGELERLLVGAAGGLGVHQGPPQEVPRIRAAGVGVLAGAVDLLGLAVELCVDQDVDEQLMCCDIIGMIL
jgi:hypothetical protein